MEIYTSESMLWSRWIVDHLLKAELLSLKSIKKIITINDWFFFCLNRNHFLNSMLNATTIYVEHFFHIVSSYFLSNTCNWTYYFFQASRVTLNAISLNFTLTDKKFKNLNLKCTGNKNIFEWVQQAVGINTLELCTNFQNSLVKFARNTW